MQTSSWVAVIGLLLGLVGFGRLRVLADRSGAPGVRRTGRIRIIVPARNEATNLPGLLADLSKDRGAATSVTVVDDHSTDQTREIAAGHRFVDLIDAPVLPAGWTGKSWACHTGARTAGPDDVLVFLDADVRVAPGAIDQLLDERDRRGGFVSVQPWHRTVRPVERLSALFNVISIIGIGAGWRNPAGLFGPVICVSNRDYMTAGGHGAVRSEVIEDVALGRRAAQAGLAVAVSGGGAAFTFRMYPDGLGQLIEGWTKNFASGAQNARLRSSACVFAFMTALCSISWQLANAVVGTSDWSTSTLVILSGSAVLTLVVMFHGVGNFGVGTAVAFPLLVVFFLATFSRSVYRTLIRRDVSWRGRSIAVGGGTR